MPVQVKICGIRRIESAKAAIDAGAYLLGFNFVPTSKRKVSVAAAQDIVREVRCDVYTVGVFQNAAIEEVQSTAKQLELDYIQLHGNEPPSYIEQLDSEIGIIKVFQVPADFEVEKVLERMKAYQKSASFFMLDREVQGEGAVLKKEKIKEIARKFPVILAGGLTPENVLEQVKGTWIQAVDVASGIETDGIEDHEKIKKFIAQVKDIALS